MKIFNMFFIIFVLSTFSYDCVLLKKKQQSAKKLKKSSNKERELSDRQKKIFKIGRNLSKAERKLKFIKILSNILKHAKKNHLKIKKIQLGQNVKKVFKNPYIMQDLGIYLQKKNLDKEIKRMQKKIRKRKLKEKHRKLGMMDMAKSAAGSATSAAGGATGGAAGDAAGGGNNMKFNFLPGFAGMPFPPFMMNGPHFHPPIDVTVNSIPNPNPKADLNPFEIEKQNLDTQINELDSIKTKLLGLDSQMSSINQQIQDGLDDKYTKIMQLGV